MCGFHHPGIYLEHLMNVVGVFAKHGHAVIVGRGADFLYSAWPSV